MIPPLREAIFNTALSRLRDFAGFCPAVSDTMHVQHCRTALLIAAFQCARRNGRFDPGWPIAATKNRSLRRFVSLHF